MESWLATDLITDPAKAAIGGFVIGLLFGGFAQSSRFCLRSASIEFWQGRLGQHVSVWLFVFGTALALVQCLFVAGVFSAAEVRQLSAPGTLSGAAIGGVLFGVGMILARGCASRLLVLSATGNLRALTAGLVVTVVAQASLSGVLSPLRLALSEIWVVGPGVRNLMDYLPLGSGVAGGVLTLMMAAAVAFRSSLGWRRALLGAGVGVTVALGWWYTAALSHVSFAPITPGSVTFTGPSADTLMALITAPRVPLDFSIGLVPGVFAGSLIASLARREFALQVFDADTGTLRYLVGAALMGFGGMLAGGCAVGAGVTGGAVLSLTAWTALFFMWMGAGLADRFIGRWGSAQPHVGSAPQQAS